MYFVLEYITQSRVARPIFPFTLGVKEFSLTIYKEKQAWPRDNADAITIYAYILTRLV